MLAWFGRAHDAPIYKDSPEVPTPENEAAESTVHYYEDNRTIEVAINGTL